eukprot:4391_1
MPSFSLNSGNYGYYFKYSRVTSNFQTFFIFMKQICSLCFFSIIALIPLWICYYIGGHYNQFYFLFHLYYVYDFLLVLFNVLLAMCIILIVS